MEKTRNIVQFLIIRIGGQSFTSMIVDLHHDINSFNVQQVEYFLKGIAPLMNWYINQDKNS